MWVPNSIAALCRQPSASNHGSTVQQGAAQVAVALAAVPFAALATKYTGQALVHLSQGTLSLCKAMSPLPVPAGVHLGRGSFFGAIAAAGAAQTGQPTWVGHALTWGPVAAQAGMTWMGGQAGALASLAVGLTDAGLGALCADAVDLLSQAPNDLQNRLAKAVVGGIAAPLVGSLIGYLGDTPVSHATGLFLLVLGSAAVATRPSFA